MILKSRLLLLSIGCMLCLSCCKDDVENQVIGTWRLASWSVEIPFDSQVNGNDNTNFLNYTNCEVNELLRFDANGIVTSKNTFNPQITISLLDGNANDYAVNEICAEGEIGFSSEFEQPDDTRIIYNGGEGKVLNNELTVIYPKAIEIFNASLTEVVERKDLILIYKKKV